MHGQQVSGIQIWHYTISDGAEWAVASLCQGEICPVLSADGSSLLACSRSSRAVISLHHRGLSAFGLSFEIH